MIALFARVRIKPEAVDRFLRYLEADLRGSLQEEGCVRFDVLRDEAEPSLFYLYEVYVDDAAYELHKKAPYFQAMFSEVGDAFAAPPEGFRGVSILPKEPGYWKKVR